jgi:hypothetical protein
MKNLLSLVFSIIVSTLTFAQKDYGFDKPWRAKSNDNVFDWFIDKLDNTSDSLLCEMFKSVNVNTDSIQWIYPTDIIYELDEKGFDYYSRKVYTANTKDKEIKSIQKNLSNNKLPNKVYNLSYYYKEGVTTLVLIEYY